MATNVYIGLAVSGNSTSALATATFDNVSVSSTTAPAPLISSVSITTGPVGSQVVISGAHFGATQGSSLVSLNATAVTVNFWSDTVITITIPTGATSGNLVVSVAPTMDNSNPVYFTVTSQPLPLTWLDQDVGTTGVIGSGTYSNGTFTIKGAGTSIGSTADNFHFVYQPLSGDGTIIARLVSLQAGTSAYPSAGVMIRETQAAGAAEASLNYATPNGSAFYYYFTYRLTTGGSATASQGPGTNLIPYWVKLVRSGNTFTGYASLNAVDWVQAGTTQTITMATNVEIGLAVTSGAAGSLATATFDNVSISATASPSPVISSISGTTGTVGTPVLISGSGFGSSQGASTVFLNDAPVTVNLWSDTSIAITIPSGATSGYLAVAVAPSMNASNAIYFTVTAYPLPMSWLDQDIGTVGLSGSATYANGTFTVNGAGNGFSGTADSFHFADQQLSGDGTIVARMVSDQVPLSTSSIGVMIRETLASGSTYFSVGIWGSGGYAWGYRATTGASGHSTTGTGISLPRWVKVVRSGNTFTGYMSTDDVNWTQVGTTQTITMATNVYAGLYVSSGATNSMATAAFDDVSLNSSSNPAPVISSTSATTGAIGDQVTITGSNFGASQNGSVVRLSGVAMIVNSWSDTSVTCTIASGAATGLLMVSVAPAMNDSNPVVFTVTTQALPSGWLDSDIGTVGTTGSAGYSSGTFTANGGGMSIGGTADAFHFVYQSLSGDGTIVARLVSLTEAKPTIRQEL